MAGTKVENHLNSLPSDFADVQPRTYDPQFISDISNKMQVPDKIKPVDNVVESRPRPYNYNQNQMAAVSMQVPESISLHDQAPNRNFNNFDFGQQDARFNYVGLMTPPRTLTMEEAFGENGGEDEMEETNYRPTSLPNGDTNAPVPYVPRTSMSDSLLHYDEDDATQIRTQVAKLSRRVAVLEQEHQRRYYRELILYPLVIGYVFLKGFSWMFKSKY